MSRGFAIFCLGALLMGWGGSSITQRVGFTGWRSADVALFAVGIILLAQAPSYELRERVRRLESQLKAPDSGTTARAS